VEKVGWSEIEPSKKLVGEAAKGLREEGWLSVRSPSPKRCGDIYSDRLVIPICVLQLSIHA
jgi:hypothetical protein